MIPSALGFVSIFRLCYWLSWCHRIETLFCPRKWSSCEVFRLKSFWIFQYSIDQHRICRLQFHLGFVKISLDTRNIAYLHEAWLFWLLFSTLKNDSKDCAVRLLLRNHILEILWLLCDRWNFGGKLHSGGEHRSRGLTHIRYLRKWRSSCLVDWFTGIQRLSRIDRIQLAGQLV